MNRVPRVFAGMVLSLSLVACGSGDSPSQVLPQQTRAYFIYVTNDGSSNVSLYSANDAEGVPSSLGTTSTVSPQYTIGADPHSRFLYVGDYNGTTMSAFSINRGTGALLPVQSPTGVPSALNMAFHPGGKLLYLPDYDHNSITPFSINPQTGALTALTATSVSHPHDLAVDPSGKYLLATSSTSNSIYVYSINSTTGLLENGTGYASGNSPTRLEFNRAGTNFYVSNETDHSVTAYSFDSTTGFASPLGSIPTPNGVGTVAFAIDPLGRYFYLSHSATDTVFLYAIGPTGMITFSKRWNWPVGSEPQSMVIDPSGKFLYVVNHQLRTLSTLTIDSGTGDLNPVGTPVATGSGPWAITLVPAN